MLYLKVQTSISHLASIVRQADILDPPQVWQGVVVDAVFYQFFIITLYRCNSLHFAMRPMQSEEQQYQNTPKVHGYPRYGMYLVPETVFRVWETK
jgi:hypothetical protein